MIKKISAVKRTALLLLAAIAVTAAVVGTIRIFWVTSQSISIQPPAQVFGGLLGSILVFIVGGVPAALVAGLFDYRSSKLNHIAVRQLWFAAAGNIVSFLGGTIILNFLIWDFGQRFLVLGGLAILGTLTMWSVLVMKGAQRRPDLSNRI